MLYEEEKSLGAIVSMHVRLVTTVSIEECLCLVVVRACAFEMQMVFRRGGADAIACLVSLVITVSGTAQSCLNGVAVK